MRGRLAVEPAKLVRLGGLAAVVAGALLLVFDALEFFLLEDPGEIGTTGVYALITAGFLLAAPLLLLGLVGLYADQAEDAGLLGLLGFLVAFVGTVLFGGAFWAQEFYTPAVAEVAPDLLGGALPGWLRFGFVGSFLSFALGWLLFGIATYRAGVYPRLAALLLAAGAVIFILPLPVPSVVFDVALAWLGFILFTGRGTGWTIL